MEDHEHALQHAAEDGLCGVRHMGFWESQVNGRARFEQTSPWAIGEVMGGSRVQMVRGSFNLLPQLLVAYCY